MADVCFVVPGIGGSVLSNNGETVWDVSNRHFVEGLLRRGEPFRRLTLPEPDYDDRITATGLVSGVTFVPGFWRYGDYRAMSTFLRRRFGQGDVVDFPYDWRRSIAVSAAQLAMVVGTVLDSRPAGTRAVIVGHSIGGLVARRYLACEGGAERCSLLVAIGTPFRGAVRALDALGHGIRHLNKWFGPHCTSSSDRSRRFTSSSRPTTVSCTTTAPAQGWPPACLQQCPRPGCTPQLRPSTPRPTGPSQRSVPSCRRRWRLPANTS